MVSRKITAMFPMYILAPTISTINLVILVLVSWMHGCADSIEISESLGDHVECTRSKVDHNVTLASGHHAGSFLKANQSIRSMDRCVEQCCKMSGCDVAFFTNDACYSVKCASIESCAPTRNTDSRRSTDIAFVARPKQSHHADVVEGGEGEPALTDNLIAEVTNESPFVNADGSVIGRRVVSRDQRLLKMKRYRRNTWTEYRDIIIALTSGFAAVAVGVLGVITMTRKLVEDDDIYSAEDEIWNDHTATTTTTPKKKSNTTTYYGKCKIPTPGGSSVLANTYKSNSTSTSSSNNSSSSSISSKGSSENTPLVEKEDMTVSLQVLSHGNHSECTAVEGKLKGPSTDPS